MKGYLASIGVNIQVITPHYTTCTVHMHVHVYILEIGLDLCCDSQLKILTVLLKTTDLCTYQNVNRILSLSTYYGAQSMRWYSLDLSKALCTPSSYHIFSTSTKKSYTHNIRLTHE